MVAILNPEAVARCKKGAKYLDGIKPGWRSDIVRDLDMESAYSCVLGQVFGDYFAAQEDLRLSDGQVEAFGFFMRGPADTVTWVDLGLAWEFILTPERFQKVTMLIDEEDEEV